MRYALCLGGAYDGAWNLPHRRDALQGSFLPRYGPRLVRAQDGEIVGKWRRPTRRHAGNHSGSALREAVQRGLGQEDDRQGQSRTREGLSERHSSMWHGRVAVRIVRLLWWRCVPCLLFHSRFTSVFFNLMAWYFSSADDIHVAIQRVMGYHNLCCKIYNTTKLALSAFGEDFTPKQTAKVRENVF